MPETNEPRPEPIRRAPLTRLVLPVLLAACATGGGPAANQPVAPVPGDAQSAAAAQPEPATDAPAATEAPTAKPAAATAATSSSPVAAYLDDPEAITAGRRMFRAVCTGYCHSTTPGVTKDAPNLFDCNWTHGSEDADLFRVIRQGVPDTEMLPFGGKIPDDTIWQVIAYVRSNSMDCG